MKVEHWINSMGINFIEVYFLVLKEKLKQNMMIKFMNYSMMYLIGYHLAMS